MLSGGWEICVGGYCTGDDIIGEAVLDAVDSTASAASQGWDVASSTAEAIWAGAIEGEPIESYNGQYDIHAQYLGENIEDAFAPVADGAAAVWNAEMPVGDYALSLSHLGDNFATIGDGLGIFGTRTYETMSAMYAALFKGEETDFAGTYVVHVDHFNETDDTIAEGTIAFFDGIYDLFNDDRDDMRTIGDPDRIQFASLWPFI